MCSCCPSGRGVIYVGFVSAYMYMQYECAVATRVVGDGRCRRSNCTGNTQFSLRRFRFVSYMGHWCPVPCWSWIRLELELLPRFALRSVGFSAMPYWLRQKYHKPAPNIDVSKPLHNPHNQHPEEYISKQACICNTSV